MAKYTESDLEEAVLEWFTELGYQYVGGPVMAPVPDGTAPERESYADVVLNGRLLDSLAKVNKEVPSQYLEQAFKQILNIVHFAPGLIQTNKEFHRLVTEGIDIEYQRSDSTIGTYKIKLFDFDTPENNDWLLVNQYTIIENKNNRRPDVLVFVNGLPLALFELKNPAEEKANVYTAISQIKTYKTVEHGIPSIFAYNELIVASDGIDARVGTISSNDEWFVRWRTMDGENTAPNSIPQLEVLVKGIFDKSRLLDIIKNFIVFESDKDLIIKKLAGYHQYHAVNKAIEKTVKATGFQGDQRAGVVWHTQGSGKSLTMLFYTGKLVQTLHNPTVVVLTDRNDLDDQLFGVFSRCRDILRQKPQQAENREHLQELLKVDSGGVVFTTIQKFMPENQGDQYPLLSDRRNIVVVADEAHRSQYDFIDGFARHMRDALPNASFIGFTGTPIELNDANTRAVFGEYVDVYDISRAVEDHTTVPIYYEARLANIQLDETEKPKIDPDFEEVTEGEEVEKKEQLKSKWARLEAMVGSPGRLKLVAKDIVEHFEDRINVMDGKGMIVTMSRRIAVELYDEIIKLRPGWAGENEQTGFVKVVMTGSASDPLNFQPHIRNKLGREAIAKRFKDPNDEMKLVIVRDMWLTGFDVPCLHTMYIDKPMKGHGLMQSIARVNRVFKDKQGGLIVDYLGIGTFLKEALANYTQAGSERPTIPQEEAVTVLLEKFEILKDMLHDFDYSMYFDKEETKAEKLRVITSAMDFVLGLEDGQERFSKYATELSYAFSLSVPNQEALKIRDEVALFLAIKASLGKFNTGGDGPGVAAKDYDLAIRQIINKAVFPVGVKDIMELSGQEKVEISILSETFLAEVEKMPYKNIALEMLKKLLNDQIRSFSKTNLVKSRSFAQMLEETIKKYTDQNLDSAKAILELIKFARMIKSDMEARKALGLSTEELAFYDALAENESAKTELGDATLKQISQELVAMLQQNTKIDWTLRENVRAEIRVQVRRLLRKYNYPPDKQENATQVVVEQAEMICKDWSGPGGQGKISFQPIYE